MKSRNDPTKKRELNICDVELNGNILTNVSNLRNISHMWFFIFFNLFIDIYL